MQFVRLFIRLFIIVLAALAAGSVGATAAAASLAASLAPAFAHAFDDAPADDAPPSKDPPPAGDVPPPSKGDGPFSEAPPPSGSDSYPSVEAPGSKPRVYLFVDRRTEAMGYVESEDNDELVLNWKDQLKTYAKARILKIVRLVEPRPGQFGIVHLRDGQQRRGVILEDGFEGVVMQIEGIRTPIPRSLVYSVELEPTFEEKLDRFRMATAPDDWPGRIELSRWLIQERRYELARQELEEVLTLTESVEAKRLYTIVTAQLALGARPSESPDEFDPDGRPSRAAARTSGPVDQRDLLPERLLTTSDVNLIRVYEMDLRNPPRTMVPPDTIRKLLENYASSDLIPARSEQRTALFRAESADVISLMFRLKARELYPEIEVLSEPPHLNTFRQRVHNAWLIPNCATSRCHGGLDAGRFFLHSRNYKDDRVRYTNLMILDQLEIDGRRMIDYDDPTMSLLVQYALPRTQARTPHPDVRGWRPVLSTESPKLLEDTLSWIRAMFRPRPKYPVDYEPPKLEALDRRDVGGGRDFSQDR